MLRLPHPPQRRYRYQFILEHLPALVAHALIKGCRAGYSPVYIRQRGLYLRDELSLGQLDTPITYTS
jgi:hypothetical protein